MVGVTVGALVGVAVGPWLGAADGSGLVEGVAVFSVAVLFVSSIFKLKSPVS